MRLWSLHPRYLDARGLTACWREGLLARKVLAGDTKGYLNHPQLERFRACENASDVIDAYLDAVCREADRRGYRFDRTKIDSPGPCAKIKVSHGQLAYERMHLLRKLALRDTERYVQLERDTEPEPHPLFECVPGGIETWEKR